MEGDFAGTRQNERFRNVQGIRAPLAGSKSQGEGNKDWIWKDFLEREDRREELDNLDRVQSITVYAFDIGLMINHLRTALGFFLG